MALQHNPVVSVRGWRLDIASPEHGTAEVKFEAPGLHFHIWASYTPFDSIGDLARTALLFFLNKDGERVVAWNTEPVQYELRFATAALRTRVELHEFADHRRPGKSEPKASAEADTYTVAHTLWLGLNRLQAAAPPEVYEKTWRHPFPTEEVDRLGNCLSLHQ
ncbi:MAG: hypothetical protein L6R28_00885 [Planctomycetes bacterium]|nr:hypothetical protein [Planctomycetota bacterium]